MAAHERMPKLKQIIDPVLAKALIHPLRGHTLLVIGELGVSSPKEIGNMLDVNVKEVSYHIRSLKARGLIRLVRTEQRRGVKEHFYELTEPLVYLDDEEWRLLPKQIQARFSLSLLKVVMSDAVAALRAGTFGAPDAHHSRLTMPVDAQGRREVTEVLDHALKRLFEIQEECGRRMTLPSDDAVPLAVYIAAFEAVPGVAGDRIVPADSEAGG